MGGGERQGRRTKVGPREVGRKDPADPAKLTRALYLGRGGWWRGKDPVTFRTQDAERN